MPFSPPGHTPFVWSDFPNLSTPLDAANLNSSLTDLVTYIQSMATSYDTYALSTFVWVTSPTTGNGVVWNGSAWISAPVFSAGVATTPTGGFTAGVASAQLVAANATRAALQIWNLDTAAVVYGSLGGTAVLNQGFVINPGGTWSTPANTGQTVYTGIVRVISTLASTALSYVEI